MARTKSKVRNDYLIASVFEPRQVEEVAERVAQTGAGVDWILTCIHGCEQLAVEQFAGLSATLGNSIEILKPDFKHRHSFIPKEATWRNLRQNYAETLTAKKGIWLIDTDIWFDGRFVGEFARLWERFPVRPVIAQPTIRQNTQDPRMKVNQNYWDLDSLTFAYSTFVELQVVMMDPKFFVWLMDYARELIAEEYKRQTDWGLDNVWCGLGTVYDPAFDAAGVSPCGVIALPVDHRDDHLDVFQKYESVIEGGAGIYDTSAFQKHSPHQDRLTAKLGRNNPLLKDQPCRVCCLHQCTGNEVPNRPGDGAQNMIANLCCRTKMACEALPEVCGLESDGRNILFPAYANSSRA